jgi:ribosomal protein S18 acetylase RimI-like enzyme
MRPTLRAATPDDESFLRSLYASTRADELQAAGLPAAQQEALLALQFNAQQMAYGAQYPEADHQIVLVNGEPAGRLLVNRSREEIRLVDISLLPQYRNRTIGASFIRQLQTEAQGSGIPLTLHVARTNPAVRFYQRLGFLQTGETGSHLQMAWRSQPARKSTLASAGPAGNASAAGDQTAKLTGSE